MGFDDNAPSAPEISKSNFNEAMFVMRRLDTLQRRMNEILKPNLIFYNVDIGIYNYECYFEDMKSVVKEMWGKMTDPEKKDCLILENLIQDMLINYPPHRKVKKNDINSPQVIFNQDKWNKMKKALDIFEKNIMLWKEAHGYGSPSIEDEGLF